MDKAPEAEFGVPKRRGRPPRVAAVETRAETVTRERRKQRGVNAVAGIKLTVNEGAVDRTNNHYRFVRDEGNRVQQLEADDYDVVRNGDVVPGGAVPTHHGGVSDTGKPYNMVLMAKPKAWHEQDQIDKLKPIDEREQQMLRGSVAGTEIASKGGAYSPETNVMERV